MTAAWLKRHAPRAANGAIHADARSSPTENCAVRSCPLHPAQWAGLSCQSPPSITLTRIWKQSTQELFKIGSNRPTLSIPHTGVCVHIHLRATAAQLLGQIHYQAQALLV